MTKSLVLGATGFIGGHVVRCLLAEGYSVRALKRPGSGFRNLPDIVSEIEVFEGSFRDPDALRTALAGCKQVVHSAMPYPIFSINWKSRWPGIRQELRNVLRAVKDAGVERFVFTSVCSTIGAPARADSLATEEAPCNLPAGSALRMKHLAEEEVRRAVHDGLPGVVVNPCFTLGPYDSKPSSGQFLLSMLQSPVDFLGNYPVNVVDVRDVAAAHVAALEKGELYTASRDRYLLGHWNTTFGEVARLARQLAGLRRSGRPTIPTGLLASAARISEWIAFGLRQSRPMLPLLGLDLVRYGSRHVSVARAVRELGMPQTPVEETLKDSLRYFLNEGMLKLPHPEAFALTQPRGVEHGRAV